MRYIGTDPRRTSTGRPLTCISTSPSFTRAPATGALVTRWTAASPAPESPEPESGGPTGPARVTLRGEAYSTEPWVITLAVRGRRSTATVTGWACGGRCAAAASAGDCICDPANQPPDPTSATPATTIPNCRGRLLIRSRRLIRHRRHRWSGP
ncbi:hypothetical protein DN051_22500 [Streptomyces cadmiisoli]|uniref:Uncharacterized protein n=1 Tax=Streptomyces cadmiisoli TaxID=2184053 RepID=A0A2Z4J3Y5_9ACTN|nr:hypothetical protein DN051_22500 [Streptomyces cadmiisoli]